MTLSTEYIFEKELFESRVFDLIKNELFYHQIQKNGKQTKFITYVQGRIIDEYEFQLVSSIMLTVSVCYNRGDKAIYVHGFAKNGKTNLSSNELVALKEFAKVLLALSDEHIQIALKAGVEWLTKSP